VEYDIEDIDRQAKLWRDYDRILRHAAGIESMLPISNHHWFNLRDAINGGDVEAIQGAAADFLEAVAAATAQARSQEWPGTPRGGGGYAGDTS
jgi:hypothetical protein